MAVLIFLTIAIIAFLFIKLFGAAARESREGPMSALTRRLARRRVGRQHSVLLLRVRPVVWIISLSLKGATPQRRKYLPDRPSRPTAIFATTTSCGRCQLDRDLPDLDVHRPGAGTMARTRSRAWTFPGKAAIVACRC
jgi:hypothetical protein